MITLGALYVKISQSMNEAGDFAEELGGIDDLFRCVLVELQKLFDWLGVKDVRSLDNFLE